MKMKRKAILFCLIMLSVAVVGGAQTSSRSGVAPVVKPKPGPALGTPGPKALHLEKECAGGKAKSCSDLGLMYSDGEGVTKDDAKAAELFQKACDRGNAVGCFQLGMSYVNGKGVMKDNNKAAQLYLKACDAGEMISCWSLGLMYSAGLGVKRDGTKATQLYNKACKGGTSFACKWESNERMCAQMEPTLVPGGKGAVNKLCDSMKEMRAVFIGSGH
jgi:hypothetical protein